jgi:hypothetical protein
MKAQMLKLTAKVLVFPFKLVWLYLTFFGVWLAFTLLQAKNLKTNPNYPGVFISALGCVLGYTFFVICFGGSLVKIVADYDIGAIPYLLGLILVTISAYVACKRVFDME